MGGIFESRPGIAAHAGGGDAHAASGGSPTGGLKNRAHSRWSHVGSPLTMWRSSSPSGSPWHWAQRRACCGLAAGDRTMRRVTRAVSGPVSGGLRSSGVAEIAKPLTTPSVATISGSATPCPIFLRGVVAVPPVRSIRLVRSLLCYCFQCLGRQSFLSYQSYWRTQEGNKSPAWGVPTATVISGR